ncbi:NG,NG-dimethylarginine dimethylaminohydrolase 1 [Bacillus sp. ZZV12-4809]|nr:NG,NG-dimethylarginine dimethylaminohydrolase 1 [Bacillus sp. ZZV12-4809]
MNADAELLRSCCNNEYDTLKEVIVCEPKNININSLINETQKHYISIGVDVQQARIQFDHFTKILRSNGIDTLELPTKRLLNEQVFTRDIGFTIGNMLLVGKMASEVRREETSVLQNFLSSNGIPYYNIFNQSIEGGDVIIDNEIVYVGISQRTDWSSYLKLKHFLNEHTVTPLPFSHQYLHLDCVFNILSENLALIYSPAFSRQEINLLSEKYDLIEVDQEEQFSLGTNILSLGNRRIVSLPNNKKVNNQLKLHRYEVIEVEFDEIIKSGGSFRCCTLPIRREMSS